MKKTWLLFSCVVLLGQLFAAVPEYLVAGKNPGRLDKIAVAELQEFFRKIYQKELKCVSEEQAKGTK